MSSAIVEFNGFSEETFRFLRDLGENNTRPWFERNRDAFRTHVLEPARELVVALGARLEEIAPRIRAIPREGGSIGTLRRDTRGSPTMPPFRTHLDLWFWEGAEVRDGDCPGFFLRLSPRALVLGVGIHTFADKTLAAYREAIVAPPEGEALNLAMTKIAQAGPYQFGGAKLEAFPAGYDPEQERSDLLRRSGLYAFIEGPVPHNIFTRRVIEYCLGHYRNMEPLHQWLVETTKRSDSPVR